jgi:PKD repeat protein
MIQKSSSDSTSLCNLYNQNYKTRLKFIRNLSILIFLVTVIFCAVQPVSAADPYASQKTAYLTAHPGQSIVPYPWDPSSSTRILPFNYAVPAAPSNNFSLEATRNQFESTSFVITAQKDLTNIGISIPDLKSEQGNSLSANSINVRTVKVWYQASPNDVWLNHNDYILAPELLLKDDGLVKVDYTNKINYLKVSINGSQQYIDISNPAAVFPASATVTDASTLQPFSLAANENKQLWVTVHVPANTPAGDYKGNITITAASETPVIMPFTVMVLPFDLETAPLEYSLYYRGRIPATSQPGINSEYKTATQYSLELQDMKDHGVLYPVLYQGNDKMLGTALSLRAQSGLPMDHIYVVSLETGNPTTPAGLSALATQVTQWKSTTTQYGFSNFYAYGIDEATGTTLQSERTAWQTAKQNGANIFVAGSPDAVNIVGDLLNVAVIAGNLNATLAAQWHSYGQRIFSYAHPQVGVEDPELYRKNYGFTLWNAGYDGAMNYAYQHSYGNIWNDFDSVDQHYRDHVFAYPTSTGVIDTIQWEGWREGVDDTRYLATLKKKEGSDVSGRAIVSNSLVAGNNMATIRKKVIAQILLVNTIAPVAGFTGMSVSGTAPLNVTFIDTSTNSPTSWTWSFGDGSTVNATLRNPVHTYTAAGNYTVSLNATNIAGFNTKTRIDYITVAAAPVANFTGMSVSGTAPLNVTFIDTSTNSPTSWAWSFGDGSTVNATLRNPVHTYTAAGNYTVSLNATNIAGFNTKTRIDYITVTAVPVANFTATSISGTAPLNVTFIDTSTNSPTSWAWSFGDGSTVNSTIRNPVHTYNATGNYTVLLNATNNAGFNTRTRVGYITVTAAPVANFTGISVSGTAPLNVTFIDTSTNSPTSWAWSFGDGSSENATIKNPIHTYNAAGTYSVSLTAINAAGSSTKTQTSYVTVTAVPLAPVAGFTGTPVSGTVPLKVLFTDASTNSPTSWTWSFGDGSSVNASAKNPIHTYTTAGKYTVTLTARNAAGNGSITKTNYITVTSTNPAPTVQYIANVTSGTAPLAVQFTVTSISARSDITSGVWDVNNDGKIEFNYRNPMYVYQTPGIYTVNLTVTNADGTGSIIKTNYITVNPASPSPTPTPKSYIKLE